MGEARDRKREEQFRYQLNQSLEEKVGAELLDRIPPATAIQIEAIAVDGIAQRDDLTIGRVDGDRKIINLYKGNQICGWIRFESFAQLGLVLSSTLFRVLAETDGVLCLQCISADRRAVRPESTADEDES